MGALTRIDLKMIILVENQSDRHVFMSPRHNWVKTNFFFVRILTCIAKNNYNRNRKNKYAGSNNEIYLFFHKVHCLVFMHVFICFPNIFSLDIFLKIIRLFITTSCKDMRSTWECAKKSKRTSSKCAIHWSEETVCG